MSLAAVIIQDQLSIPEGVNSLVQFREWAQTEGFPEKGISWFGYIHIDMSPAELNNNRVSSEACAVLRSLTRGKGQLYVETALLSNFAANLSTCPDLIYLSFESIKLGRVEFVRSKKKADQLVEILGSPDMIMEVVSESSVEKDTVILKEKYWRADVQEYWVADVRGYEIEFSILCRGEHDWVTPDSSTGWQRSGLFGRNFRLAKSEPMAGHFEYHLEVQDD
jgi:Uma2 family endonuclease